MCKCALVGLCGGGVRRRIHPCAFALLGTTLDRSIGKGSPAHSNAETLVALLVCYGGCRKRMQSAAIA